jgi:hypothetical protein
MNCYISYSAPSITLPKTHGQSNGYSSSMAPNAARPIPINETPMRFPALAVCFADAEVAVPLAETCAGGVAGAVVKGVELAGVAGCAAERVVEVVAEEEPGAFQQGR